jgi:sodium/proline symporter
VIIGAAALAFSLGEVRMIFWFVLFAWSGLGAAFGPVILCALYDQKTTRGGAAAGMLGGFLASVVWVLAFKAACYDLYEMIPGFIAGLALTIGVSRSTAASRPRREAREPS